LKESAITAKVNLPPSFPAVTKLRLRTPGNTRLKSVTLNGKHWTQFDAEGETITIPALMNRTVSIVASY
jgi:hypothetical protein